MVKYTQYSHGDFVGFIAAWANWIAIVSVIPVEAIASIQYMSSWPWEGKLGQGFSRQWDVDFKRSCSCFFTYYYIYF